MSGFSSPSTETPTLSYSQVHLQAAAQFIQYMAQENPGEEGNLIFPVLYEKAEDVGPRWLHPDSNPFEAPLSGSQSASALRETNPIYNRCPQTAAQCSP